MQSRHINMLNFNGVKQSTHLSLLTAQQTDLMQGHGRILRNQHGRGPVECPVSSRALSNMVSSWRGSWLTTIIPLILEITSKLTNNHCKSLSSSIGHPDNSLFLRS